MQEIESLIDLKTLINTNKSLTNKALQGLDLSSFEENLLSIKISNCLFLGCRLTKKTYHHLIDSDNLVFPSFNYTFKVFRKDLYTRDELYKNFNKNQPKSYSQTLDYKINKYYKDTGANNPISIQHSLIRRMHDHAISNALKDEIKQWKENKKIVAIMGGHMLKRSSKEYFNVALIGKKLSENGFLLLSGGGPGGMEATHLGAWFTHRKEEELIQAIKILSKAETYKNTQWLSTSFEIIEKYPSLKQVESIGIPTWYYGHEPPTPFATKIAKYFANSVREEGLLTIAKGGVIFAPGSIGTVQEVFQEAAQNHYPINGISPMVFLNIKYWKNKKPVYPLLKSLAREEKYNKLISIHNKPTKVIHAIISASKKS